MTIKCLNCNKEFEAKRSTAKYCSDSCRKLAFQDKQPSVLMQDIEKKSVVALEDADYWIPNWKRSCKARKEAFVDLMRITQEHAGLYMFQGYQYTIE